MSSPLADWLRVRLAILWASERPGFKSHLGLRQISNSLHQHAARRNSNTQWTGRQSISGPTHTIYSPISICRKFSLQLVVLCFELWEEAGGVSISCYCYNAFAGKLRAFGEMLKSMNRLNLLPSFRLTSKLFLLEWTGRILNVLCLAMHLISSTAQFTPVTSLRCSLLAAHV